MISYGSLADTRGSVNEVWFLVGGSEDVQERQTGELTEDRGGVEWLVWGVLTGEGGVRGDGQLGWHGARGPTRPQLCPRQRLNGPRNWSRLCVCVCYSEKHLNTISLFADGKQPLYEQDHFVDMIIMID